MANYAGRLVNVAVNGEYISELHVADVAARDAAVAAGSAPVGTIIRLRDAPDDGRRFLVLTTAPTYQELSRQQPAILGGTIYVDSASGDDGNDGLTPGTALATLERARDRIPNDGGTYEVQCAGAGPYQNPGNWPALSSITVFADRSAPVATKDPVLFTPVAGGRTAQIEDASFGAVATTAGVHWYRYFFDLFGIFTGFVNGPCLTRPAGTIGVVEGDTGLAGFQERCDVYEWTTVLQLDRDNVELPGGGITFIGFILDSVSGGGIFLEGYSFQACRTDLLALGNLQIRDGVFNGYLTGNSTLTLLGLDARGFQIYVGASARIVVRDEATVQYVVDDGSNRIRINSDGLLAFYDLENSTGVEVGGGSRVHMRAGFLNNPSQFIRPRSLSAGNPTMHAASIQFTEPVVGTCVNGIELINGASLVANGNLSGLVASGYDVRLDGSDFAFGEEGFSLDTGGFTR